MSRGRSITTSGSDCCACPTARSRQGKRDLALLHLLGSAGLRHAEASRRRSSDPRLRQAIKRSTSWRVTVRYGKRGRTRAIPLDEDTLARSPRG